MVMGCKESDGPFIQQPGTQQTHLRRALKRFDYYPPQNAYSINSERGGKL